MVRSERRQKLEELHSNTWFPLTECISTAGGMEKGVKQTESRTVPTSHRGCDEGSTYRLSKVQSPGLRLQ